MSNQCSFASSFKVAFCTTLHIPPVVIFTASKLKLSCRVEFQKKVLVLFQNSYFLFRFCWYGNNGRLHPGSFYESQPLVSYFLSFFASKRTLRILNNMFSCDKCRKVYTKKQQLKSHNQAKHIQLRFECKVCDKTFFYNGNLRRHEKKAHPENVTTRRKKQMNFRPVGLKYGCERCEAVFVRKDSLKRHFLGAHEGKMCVTIAKRSLSGNRTFTGTRKRNIKPKRQTESASSSAVTIATKDSE